MAIRELTRDKWPLIEPHFTARGMALPSADLARIIVATDDDAIVAFLVSQWVPHMEPLWIDPAYRGKVYWPGLLHQAERLLGGGPYYVFAPNDHIADLARAEGLTEMPWTVFKQELACRS